MPVSFDLAAALGKCGLKANKVDVEMQLEVVNCALSTGSKCILWPPQVRMRELNLEYLG